VIFGGEPEYGYGEDTPGFEFSRDFDGGERFVDGVGGTGEEANLLAGDDSHRAGGEAVEIARRRGIEDGAGGKTLILLAQDFYDGGASGGGKVDFTGCGEHSGFGGRVREILADAGKFVNESGEDFGGVRQFAEG